MNEVFSTVELISLDKAGELLNISVGKVRRLVEEHALISIKRGTERLIPRDIIIDGEPLHSLKGTIMLLLDCGLGLEDAMEWLYTENDLLETTPMASLLAGHKSPVRRAAQFLAQ
ncbi:MAG: Rv2175c family DNA-binding protein [Microbacteriaceae bacterium]